LPTKRNRILQAAVLRFAEQGFSATGIRDLGSAAGFNSASLYHYAPAGKSEILVMIMTECLEELHKGGRASLQRSADPVEQLRGLVQAHVAITATNPLTASVTDQEVRSIPPGDLDRLMGLRDAYESMFASVLEKGSRVGSFHIRDLTLTRLALLEMCNGVAHWYTPTGRLSIPELEDLFTELAARLVGLEPSGHGPIARYQPTRLATEPDVVLIDT